MFLPARHQHKKNLAGFLFKQYAVHFFRLYCLVPYLAKFVPFARDYVEFHVDLI